MKRALACLLLAACSTSSPRVCPPLPDAPLVDDGAWTGEPTDVSLTAQHSPLNQVFRFTVPVQVGGATSFTALLDTGSAGLRILPNVVPDSAFDTITSIPIEYAYLSGVALHGVVAYARVQLGDRATQSPIPVMLVRTVDCAIASSYCRRYGNAFDAFDGSGAIIGVGMRNGTSCAQQVGDPIAQLLGHPSYIVKAPATGEGVGTLRIGPSNAELASYSNVQLLPGAATALPLADGTPSWKDDRALACIADQHAELKKLCASTLMDTGTPAIEIFPAGWLGNDVNASGDDTIDVTIFDGDLPVVTDSFVVDDPPVRLRSGVELSNAAILGTPFFARFDVYFDHASGTVGFLAH